MGIWNHGQSTWTGNKHVWNKSTILLLLVVPKWQKNLDKVNVEKRNLEEKLPSHLNEKLIEAVHLIAFCIFEYVISAVENYIFSIMYQC